MTRLVRAFTMLMAALALVPRSPAAATEAHVLRYTDGVGVTTLDPLLATSGNIAFLSNFTMAHLVNVDAAGHPVAELIETVPTQANGGISRDGKTITYKIRRGVKWSDGMPFDADDVAYSLRVVADHANLIADHSNYDHIASFAEPDKFTIVVRLTAPYAPFVVRAFSSSELGCLLPKHILGSSTNINRAPYNGLPVGIGPFRYTAFRRSDRVEMEANPYYFRGTPKLRKIIYPIITDDNTLFAQTATGELDMWAAIGGVFAGRVEALPRVEVTTAPTLYVSGIYLNISTPALHDVVVRRALRLATDRKFLFSKISYGVGRLSESVVAPSTDGYVALPQIPYDTSAANALLDRSGWKPGSDGIRAKNGVRLAITAAVLAGYLPSSQSVQLLRDSWKRIGIALDEKSYASQQFFAPANDGGIVQNSRFDVALFSYAGNAFADISDGYGCAYRSPKGFNSSQYCNPRVDTDVARYVRSYDAAVRKPIAAHFQKLVDDDVPEIVTYVRSFAYGHTRRLINFQSSAYGFQNIMNWDVTP